MKFIVFVGFVHFMAWLRLKGIYTKQHFYSV